MPSGPSTAPRERRRAPASDPRPLWRLLTAEDLRDHPFQVAFIVLLLLATLVGPPLAIGVTTLRRVRATEEVTGTVTHEAKYGTHRPSWFYTFEYRVAGTPYRLELRYPRRRGLDVGQPIRVFVDPAAPDRPYFSRDLVKKWFVLTFLFWGVAAVLACLREVHSGRHLLRPRYAWAFALLFTPASFLVVQRPLPPGSWWMIALQYLAVLAITTLWLGVRRKR